jgi:4-hydroxy-tetrahydrodipicolinate synthase
MPSRFRCSRWARSALWAWPARAVNARLLPSFAFETGDDAPNPVPTKAMLRVLGLPGGQCRLPMGDAPDWVEPKARQVLADLQAARG